MGPLPKTAKKTTASLLAPVRSPKTTGVNKIAAARTLVFIVRLVCSLIASVIEYQDTRPKTIQPSGLGGSPYKTQTGKNRTKLLFGHSANFADGFGLGVLPF